MHATSPILNSFTLWCYYRNQWHEYSKGCSEQKPGGHVWIALLTPPTPIHENILWILSLNIPWSVHQSSTSIATILVQGIVISLLECWSWLISSASSHSTLYSLATEIISKSESDHAITPPPAPSPSNTHSHVLEILECVSTPPYAPCVGPQQNKECTSEQK